MKRIAKGFIDNSHCILTQHEMTKDDINPQGETAILKQSASLSSLQKSVVILYIVVHFN